jgi:hypothetical protein
MTPRSVRNAVARSRRAPVLGRNCSGTCATRDHSTYGECLRAKGIQLSPAVNGEYGKKQKTWDKDLDHYESATRQGLQPSGTQRHQVDQALREADSG